MKQVININFHGRVIPIEVSAFELLKNYTDSLNRYFANEEGKDEIINDIENRIAELFQERLKSGITCITDDDVNAIIKSIGRTEDFEESETSSGKSQQSTTPNIPFKRLYRNENNKVLGGVCSGIANYFGVDPVIIRVLAVIIFGVAFVPYIILWIAVPSTTAAEIGGPRKRLYRDMDDKKIAGVCSGIAHYFNISTWIPRVIFIVPFLSFIFHWSFLHFHPLWHFSFSPGALMIYIILWIAVPEANTTAEKLEMKGEKVDINSIKNSVIEEMKGVKQRAEKFATDNKRIVTDLSDATKRTTKSLGDIIVVILKIFAYLIIGMVAFVLVIVLLAIALAAIGIFPATTNFFFSTGWQTILAWGTLLFFISVPVIGIITWIIRRLAKAKRHGKMLLLTFISLWIIGWACIVCLTASVSREFKTASTYTEISIPLSNPGVNKLELTAKTNTPAYYMSWRTMQPFANMDDDTIYLKNTDVVILPSTNDSFKVTMVKTAYGADHHSADMLANGINFNVVQVDSILQLDKGIAITRENKFRNQRIQLIVYVPVGKQIRVDKTVGGPDNMSFDFTRDNDLNIDLDKKAKGWKENVDYIMKIDGLYTLDGKPAGVSKDNEEEEPKDTDDDSD
jgi:phage shock protein PspC (stress-responsive transcriptional regulator)